ncbi:MAG: type II toxin-antitoxin system Phd/YefM family antitoxin [Gemmatimonadetes bacterium]|nr:type II toxin-antitoxin system Phd/YefM family antitoxin [Gemmatimonadota bacterium]
MARSRPGTRAMKASEFKAKCLDTMDQVYERRLEVVITKRGRPVAKLVPAENLVHSPIGFMRGTVIAQGDLVAPDFEAWAAGE